MDVLLVVSIGYFDKWEYNGWSFVLENEFGISIWNGKEK